MRLLKIALATLAIVACSTAPATRKDASTAQSSEAYLLDSAASDFHAHGPGAVRVRNVRLGHVANTNGQPQYLICGEFQPVAAGDQAWTPFATIKTSGYEQYLGAATSYCSSVTWDEAGDLSSQLQRRLDAK